MSPSSAPSKFRFVMGMMQIAGVGFSLGIIVIQGLTGLAIAAVIATTLLTLLSLFLFRRSSTPHAGRNHGA